MKNLPRQASMYLGQQVGAYKLVELAEYFNLGHYGSVASQISNVTKEMQSDRSLSKQINSIVKRFDP